MQSVVRKMWSIILYFLVLGIVRGSRKDEPLVETKLGIIKGLRSDDGSYSMFLGIPYGKVDKNFPFGVATPYPRFEETFLGYNDTHNCPEVDEFNSTIAGTLDCLNLNIYVPSGASYKSNLPVMVWVYGGVFKYGSGGRLLYGPKYIVRHDVIFVTLNFRSGPYGFMCLDTPEVSGNQGLKDQLLALRWVNANIESFGGDFNKVTLAGQSSGAASVESHLLSKKEKLFNQVILQSGSIFSPWAIKRPDRTQPFKLAESLGYYTKDLSKVLSFLSKVDIELLTEVSFNISMVFKMCIENEFENVESFLTEHSRYLNVHKARIPIIIGTTDKERMILYEKNPKSIFNNKNVNKTLSEIFSKALSEIFNYDKKFFKMEDIVRQFYLGDDEISYAVRDKLTDFSSDFDFTYPTQRSVQAFLDMGAENVYNYVFAYSGEKNLMKKGQHLTAKGAAHADELSYLFDMKRDPSTPNEEDQRVIDMLTKLWTNFVKYGNPTPETTKLLPVKWLPVTKKSHRYLYIDSVLSEGKYPFHKRMAFWKLFFEANKKNLKLYNAFPLFE